ncbi:glycosyltransferase family 2 protein [Kiritimatiella glycovorans]|uniref:N-glycosyltransferase n=1 Tax=Kiritimatiella glycovorans TaxID=1307763 RepID=A0A0G3EH60_9BACT|nr:glycosyltransferase family 2 protein [Kiritimatiella glycovorans]AKJ63474.1 N-glycosyltransferase [Kiritimatiella glycovorans]
MSEPAQKIAAFPPVSVLINTKGRPGYAVAAARSVLASAYPGPRQIAVVEEGRGAAAEGLPGGVEHYVLDRAGGGFGAARNQAVRRARHDLIVFIDDDCEAEEDWLLRLLEPLEENPDAGAVGGAVRVPPCGPVGRCENILGFPAGGLRYIHEARGRVIRRPTFSTCNCAIRREALEEAGGFDEARTMGGEDEDLSRRIAARRPVLYTPHAVVRHRPRDGLLKVLRWFYRRGRAAAAGAEHAGAFVLHKAVTSPVLRLLALVLLSAALPGPGGWLLLPAAALAYAGVILHRFRWARGFGMGAGTRALLPVVRTTMDLGFDAGAWRELGARALRRRAQEGGR